MTTSAWIARITGGRITLDAETDLPDGEVELIQLAASSMRCDRLLFVVTRSELEQLESAARERKLEFDQRDGHLGEYYDLGMVGPSRIYAVRTGEGPFGHKGSASQTIYWTAATGAKGVISVGMAFGVSQSLQTAGDVLVSTHLLAYDHRTVKSKHELPFTDYPTVQARPASRTLLRIMDDEVERTTSRSFRVHRGALLSGAAKIHSRAYRDHLLAALYSRGQPIVGGEMEGVGLLAAAEAPAWLVVKGIIDFADESRDTDFKKNRDPACKNAAGFVLDALLNERQPSGQDGREP